MNNKQREHIGRIRQVKFGLDENGHLKDKNPLIEDLMNSIKHLSGELYSKETHFIFELIQNAEDNTYKKGIEPSLSLRLARIDPTNTQNAAGALIIQNNEIGFSPDNVDAICSVGKTTKRKIQGYIGEKGIGFKSVFRVTTMPYIFSGGYQFCLPEKNKETGLGYIVPYWIEKAPKEIDPAQTLIILPLNKPDISYERIKKTLKEIEPETILFLSKLKEIIVEIDSKDKLTILKDDSKAPLVQILVEEKKGDKSVYRVDERVDEFLLHTQTFSKPTDVNTEKRKDIGERNIAIAFPLGNDNKSAGKIFAYLPIHSDTHLPFLINSDFLLTSSREKILEDEPWNKWLRDSISNVFVSAFTEWIKIKTYRSLIFNFIPLETYYSFFEPIVKSIQNELKVRPIIPTEPDEQMHKPEQTLMTSKHFRTLLQGTTYPKLLLETRLVLSEIEKYSKQLNAIGVKPLSLDLVKQCFQDRRWVTLHNYDWLLKSYKYLLPQNFTKIGLTDCPMVPAMIEDKFQWSCDKEQPIYFECNEDSKKIIKHAPGCARVPLAFLDTSFFEQVKDDAEIRKWMTNTLSVNDFSNSNYAVDVLTWFKENYQTIEDQNIVSTTIFLSQFADTDIDFKDIPILLADGKRMLLSETKRFGIQAVVTPEALDPETGWQNIFVTEEDRKQFVWLSNDYIVSNNLPEIKDNLKELWSELDITAYPPPFKFEGRYNRDNDLNYHEKVFCHHVNVDYRSTRGYAITNYRPLSVLNLSSFSEYFQKDKEVFAKSLINWLNYQEKEYVSWQRTKVSYFYRLDKQQEFESELLASLRRTPWLPTSKGFVIPNQAFLSRSDIKEILGNSVPYFQGKLPSSIIKLLGIRTQTTTDELVSVLEQRSRNGNGSKEFAERVYRTLYSRVSPSDHNILSRFKQNKLILVSPNSGEHWVSCNDAIWKNRNDILGNDFAYLEKMYPKLKEFFVDILKLKEDVDTEVFARRWLKLQSESGRKSWEIENILATIYSKILPICKMDEERPSWWDDFMNKALIWTQNKTFENPKSVYVPDEGYLKATFLDSGISFSWRPEKDSFADWTIFYKTFDLPYLSESVSVSLAGYEKCKIKDQPDFLTDASKILIVTWLREKSKTDYQRLVKNQLISDLNDTEESRTSSLEVVYRLGKKERKKMVDSFWDRTNKQLIIMEGTNGRLKNSIALTLASSLMPNRAYKELADWIELILGEKEWKWRINQKGWQRIPDEVKDLIDDHKQKERATPPELDFVKPTIQESDDKPVISPNMERFQGSLNIVPEEPDSKTTRTAHVDNNKRLTRGRGEDPPQERQSVSPITWKFDTKEPKQESRPAKRINFENELEKSFNRPGETKLQDRITDDGKAKNPDRRREKSYEEHHERLQHEPSAGERRKKTIRTILEGPDEQVREYLSQLYGGKCQICDKTFPERDGQPFFVANYIVPRKVARSADTSANALCLCADHFAKWQHGAIEAEDILEQIKDFKTDSEGGDSQPILMIKLCGERCNIEFKEKHIVDLQELLKTSDL